MGSMDSFPGRLWIVVLGASALAAGTLSMAPNRPPLLPALLLAVPWIGSSALFARHATTVHLAGRGESLPAPALLAALALTAARLALFRWGPSLSPAAAVLGALFVLLAVLAAGLGLSARFGETRLRGPLAAILWIALLLDLPRLPLLARELLCGIAPGELPLAALGVALAALAGLALWRHRRLDDVHDALRRGGGRPLQRDTLALPRLLAHVALCATGGLASSLVAASLAPYLASFGRADWSAIHRRATSIGAALALAALLVAAALALPLALPFVALVAAGSLLLHLGERRSV